MHSGVIIITECIYSIYKKVIAFLNRKVFMAHDVIC